MRPNVGLKPTTPLYAAGRSTEPTVCEPNAHGTMRAATATPEPVLEPPGVCSAFQGLKQGAGSPSANSVVWSLPRSTAPALRASAMGAASASGTRSAHIFEPAAVRMPAVSKMSFAP